LLNIHGNEI